MDELSNLFGDADGGNARVVVNVLREANDLLAGVVVVGQIAADPLNAHVGNAGIAEFAECVPYGAMEFEKLANSINNLKNSEED